MKLYSSLRDLTLSRRGNLLFKLRGLLRYSLRSCLAMTIRVQ